MYKVIEVGIQKYKFKNRLLYAKDLTKEPPISCWFGCSYGLVLCVNNFLPSAIGLSCRFKFDFYFLDIFF